MFSLSVGFLVIGLSYIISNIYLSYNNNFNRLYLDLVNRRNSSIFYIFNNAISNVYLNNDSENNRVYIADKTGILADKGFIASSNKDSRDWTTEINSKPNTTLAKNSIDISGGSIIVTDKGGNGTFTENDKYTYFGQTQCNNVLPLSFAGGAIFLLAPELKANVTSRLGNSWDGANISRYSGANGTAGNPGGAGGTCKRINSILGVSMMIIAKLIDGLNMHMLSTGGIGGYTAGSVTDGNTAGIAYAGGAGGPRFGETTGASGGGGGAGTAGAAPAAGGLFGQGGGGGGSGTAGAGGAGGAGGRGGGGGGGGAARSTYATGAGGVGGAGWALVVEY